MAAAAGAFGEGEGVGVVEAGVGVVARGVGRFAEVVERLALAAPVADPAEQRDHPPVMGGGRCEVQRAVEKRVLPTGDRKTVARYVKDKRRALAAGA